MRHLRYADTELKTRGINHRVGSFRYKDLGEGDPGSAGNFFLRLVWSQSDFFSPRHLHNFDQVRVQLEGEFDFAADGAMRPGTIGYFPEGTPYGPQTSQDETLQLVLQIGGPSGAGYLSEAQRIAAVDALAATGRFEAGRYFAPGDRGTTGVDSLQAAWEHAMDRKMAYPPARFERPLLLHPEAFAWQAQGAGVQRRQLWDFGADTVALASYALAPGATLDLAGTASYFFESGTAEAGGQTIAAFDTVHLSQGETINVIARQPTKLLAFRHPVFNTSPAPRRPTCV